ncbi:AI-2E family transporter [Natronogracilivirga saccharolytica]|uniref:AI-2E family transporter n=1 Tax=Natronogracilivirga saccharolytica TaxID=2812953 RepID=A0A8J7UTA6_9BACT|nr:AI-2E family transporter [Natronogracilivirga saccharolytica]MBP3191150.1 AI-2E family transporter [Natronogracilivirga saccharolytica]
MKKLNAETFIRLIIGLAAVLLFLLILYRFFTLVLYALIALVITYILDPFVNRMQAVGMNRTLAISIVISSLILLLVWFSSTILPAIANQLIILSQQLNIDAVIAVTAQIEEQILEHLPFLQEGILIDNVPNAVDALFQTEDFAATLNNILGIFADIFWAFLVVPFATFFILKDGARLRRNILQLVPNKYFETVLTGIEKIEKRLVTYFKSVGLQSIIIATTATITLSFVGLNNALSVGIAAGVANIIPYFGPIIGYVLSIIVSILETGDFSLVIFVIIAIAITQVIDNIIVQPLLFSRSANLHPLVVLFVVMTGAELAGIFGMLIAVPLTAVIVITAKQISWSLENYHVFRLTNN